MTDSPDARQAEIAALREQLDAVRRASRRHTRVLDRLDEAVIVAHPVHGILYANARFEELLGYGPDEYLGQVASRLVYDDAELERLQPILEPRIRGLPATYRARFRRRDGSYFWGEVNGNASMPDHDGELVSTITDVSQRKSLEEAYRLKQFVFDHATEAVFLTREDGRLISVNQEACRRLGYSESQLLDRHFTDVVRDMGRADWPAHWSQLRREKKAIIEMAHVPKNGPPIPADVSMFFFEMDGTGYSCALARDVTERQAAVRSQRLLQQELNHRVKNTLASVQSVVEQTVRRSDSLEQFREDFAERLRAMVVAHEQVARREWTNAAVEVLLERMLRPYDSMNIDRQGGRVELPAAQAAPFCMIVSELITNAIRHGSLTCPDGSVDVSWRVDDACQLQLDWQERGGPPVTVPTQRGFGTMLIEEMTRHQLRGKATLAFEPDGFRCTIAFPYT